MGRISRETGVWGLDNPARECAPRGAIRRLHPECHASAVNTTRTPTPWQSIRQARRRYGMEIRLREARELLMVFGHLVRIGGAA